VTTYLSIKQALKLLTLMRSQRLTKEERDRVNAAIMDLKRALVDPEYRASLEVGGSKS
tara:strand:- start:1912 stop:2085 length:174 start_codon:yes stop_codon:yes gene_type:complete